MRGGLLSLYQRSGIGFILQNTDDSGSGPSAILSVSIATLRMGHPIIPLIGQWRENAHSVQLLGNMGSTESLQALSENLPHYVGGVFVHLQALMLVTDFQIAVNREGTNKIATAPFYIQSTPGLNGNVPAVRFIHNVLDGNRQVICCVILCIHIVVDGNKADTIGREYPAHIAASLNVLTPQT